jgi:hypothetical protein
VQRDLPEGLIELSACWTKKLSWFGMTPGLSATRLKTPRALSGNPTIRLLSITWPSDELFASSSGAVVVTSTDSLISPEVSVKSTAARCSTCNVTAARTAFLNPAFVTATSYSPGLSSGTT